MRKGRRLGGYLLDVEAGAELRQGDLIRRSVGASPFGEWGFVLTADCDIAQGKAGDHFTYLEVVQAETYLERAWAPTQLRRLIEKQSKYASEQLSGFMKRSGLDLSLTPQQLVDWVSESHPDKIVAATNRTGRPVDARCRSVLDGLHTVLATLSGASYMRRFVEFRSAIGDSPDKIKKSIAEAFQGEKGFPDFFLLPELPGQSGYGFAVMLRSIRSVESRYLYSTALDARIDGAPEAFWRAGRLDDGVRFAITQKLAFLFSRIGMPEHYENECDMAVELMTGALIENGK